ncbi:MAG: LamG domain-containing protein [Thermoguttaceae bacterium]|jgi:hypothetical protein|nr:LamG domain-containing protein [Thermoguttaceae bacterium]
MVSIYRNGLLLPIVLTFVFGLAAEAGAAIVSHWSFDEGSGSVAYDSIGGNHGTLAGATAPDWIVGKLGGALDFERAHSQVILAGSNNSVTKLSGAKTFSFWTNPLNDGSGASNGFLAIDNNTTDNRWYIDDNNLAGAIRIRGTGTVSNVLSYSGTWQHVVISDDGNSTKVYANGKLKGSISATINYASLPTTSVLKIGAALHVGTSGLDYRYMDGSLDDVTVWNEALSAGQAMALYSLADTADLGYAADKAQQLFAIHAGASSHVATFEGLAWTYATGLSTDPADLGKVVVSGDSYLLPLDSAGTGVIGQPGLVAHWKFDEGSGSVAADSAGDCHGALTGDAGEPSWTAGVVGSGALSFNSYDNQFVDGGSNNAVTNMKGDKSLVFWVKPSTDAARGSNGLLGLDKDASNRWYADDSNEGSDVRTYDSRSGSGQVNDVLSYNTWQQVALVDEGSGMRVYVDGQFKGIAGSSYDFSELPDDAIFRIGGARHSGAVVFLEGLMDDVGVWRRALSAPEIMALHSLALSDFNYDQGEAQRLFALYSAGPGGGELMLDSFWRWEYTTGLSTDLGKLTMYKSNVYFLRLHADGTGLMAIPEPGTFGLLACALVAMLPGRRRRR